MSLPVNPPNADQLEPKEDNWWNSPILSAVSQAYDKLENWDIKIPKFSSDQVSQFEESEVQDILEKFDTNKSDVKGDILAKILNTIY